MCFLQPEEIKWVCHDYETYTASTRYMTPNTKKAKPPPSVTLNGVREKKIHGDKLQ